MLDRALLDNFMFKKKGKESSTVLFIFSVGSTAVSQKKGGPHHALQVARKINPKGRGEKRFLQKPPKIEARIKEKKKACCSKLQGSTSHYGQDQNSPCRYEAQGSNMHLSFAKQRGMQKTKKICATQAGLVRIYAHSSTGG